jgi:RNA polymerase sigma-70 factor (ECF subfamily)
MANPSNQKNSWFRKTVVNLESPLLSYGYKIISRHAPSEEIVQEGFLKLWTQEYPRFENHYPKAWLYKICRNMAIDYLRREKRIDLDDDLENILSRPCISESLFDASIIIKEISKLPKIEQEVLVLRFSDELSYKEISDVVGITPSHVGVKIHDGLQAIRGIILKELDEIN